MAEKTLAKDPGPRGEGVVPQGLEQETSPKGRGPYLPRELRIRLFEEVKRLRKEGLTYKEVIDLVQKRHGVRLYNSHIRHWVHGLHSPYNKGYIPSIELLKPSEELAYVIGVILGDGYAVMYNRRTIKGYNTTITRIGLKVKDLEFAEEFGRCLAKVLGRRPLKPRHQKSSGRYVVEISSETVYELLKKPVDLDRLRRYIEHCGRCMAAFLRGFFDSEGCVDKKGCMSLSNTDLRLLEYVKDLLSTLGLDVSEPRPHMKQEKTYKKECYYIRIRVGSNLRFYKKIGLTIRRKRKRLEEYLRRRQAKPPSPLFTLLYTYISHTTNLPDSLCEIRLEKLSQNGFC